MPSRTAQARDRANGHGEPEVVEPDALAVPSIEDDLGVLDQVCAAFTGNRADHVRITEALTRIAERCRQ